MAARRLEDASMPVLYSIVALGTCCTGAFLTASQSTMLKRPSSCSAGATHENHIPSKASPLQCGLEAVRLDCWHFLRRCYSRDELRLMLLIQSD